MAPEVDAGSGLLRIVSPDRRVRTAADVVLSSEVWRYQMLEAQRRNREKVITTSFAPAPGTESQQVFCAVFVFPACG
jgi:hypothetical protein